MDKYNLKNVTVDKIKAVILDMDGVLVDTEPVHIESFRILLRDLQMEYDEAFLNSFVGHSVESNIKMIFEKMGKSIPEVIGTEMRRREAVYLDLLRETDLRPIPGITDLVSVCRQNGKALALATSSIREQADTILEKLSAVPDGTGLKWKEILRVIVSGDEVQYKKPAPDIYQLAMQRLKSKPEQCIAIEDSPAGIQSARAAGIYCIALKNRYWNKEQLKDAQADWIVDSIEEIVIRLSAAN